MPVWSPMQAISRPAYFDRDPAVVAGYFGAGVGAHGGTVRWTYTPPAAYAAFVESIQMMIAINVVGGAPALNVDTIDLLPAGGGTFTSLSIVRFPVVGWPPDILVIPNYGYLTFGDTLRYVTSDSSGGGNNIYHFGSYKGTEFLY